MKCLIKILFFVFFLSFFPEEINAQQEDMFKQKKERKRIWRRWRKNREAYNPYLKKTASKKTSARIDKGTKKEMRKQKRLYKKELKRLRKKKGIPQPPKD
jgi:aminoglycoside phosphotransferase family enzyme